MQKNKTDKLAEVKAEEAKKVALTTDFCTFYVRAKKDGGIMRPVKAQVALYEKSGHFYRVKNDYALSYEGYKLLNKVASISTVTPQKVMVDEKEQPNPYIERNPKTKMIETVSIRKIGIGLSLIGNITVIDKTLFYNIYSYFIESIQAKMKKVVWEHGKATKKKLYPDCAITGTKDEKPDKPGSWAFFETVSPLGLWINYQDQAIIDCLNEHTQRQRFGDRIAQTIVERNILKDHPAIGISKVQPQEKGTPGSQRAFVTVYGYRHEFGTSQVAEILAQAERGSQTIQAEVEVIEKVRPEEEEEAIKEVETEQKNEKDIEKKEKKKSPAEMEEPPEEYYLKQQEAKKEGEK